MSKNPDDEGMPPWWPAAEEAMTTGVQRMTDLVEPVLRSEDDLAKSLITLSAGALVVSVSILQLRPQFGDDSRELLWIAWLALCLSLILLLARYRWLGLARSRVLGANGQLFDALEEYRSLPAAEQTPDRLESLAMAAWDKTGDSHSRAVNWSMRLAFAAFCSFVAGVVSMLLYVTLAL